MFIVCFTWSVLSAVSCAPQPRTDCPAIGTAAMCYADARGHERTDPVRGDDHQCVLPIFMRLPDDRFAVGLTHA